MFSAPTNMMTIGRTSLELLIRHPTWKIGISTYQGTIVILNPASAHTLRLVIVLHAISTKAVKVTPKRECTAVIFPTDHTTYPKKPIYARYRNTDKGDHPSGLERSRLYCNYSEQGYKKRCQKYNYFKSNQRGLLHLYHAFGFLSDSLLNCLQPGSML